MSWSADRRPTRAWGIECKWQGVGGSAEEKIPATIQDIAAWPIPGLVVFAGQGFSSNMTSYLHSTGKAVVVRGLWRDGSDSSSVLLNLGSPW